MKTRFLLFAASLLILSSCSSRYGYMPKGKKQKHTVAKKEFRKKKIAPIEGITIKRPDNVSNYQQPEVAVVEVEPSKVKRTKTNTVAAKKANNHKEVKTPVQAKTRDFVLSPPTIEKINKAKELTEQQDTKAAHSWLWYLIVGLIFLLLAALLIWPFGWIFYVIGVICIVIGLLALLGIV